MSEEIAPERNESGQFVPASEMAKLIDGKLCLSSAAMCDLFGVTKQSLGNWVKHGCPKARVGWYNLHDVLEWKGMLGVTSGKGEPTAQQQKLQFDAEVRQQQVEQLRLKNERSRSELIPRAEIVGALSPVFAELKRFLLSLGREHAIRFAPYVDAVTARKLGREIDEDMKGALRIIATGFEDAGPGSTKAKRK